MPSNDQLKTFVSISECGNLTQAAKQLGRTQSAISVQIQKLEEELKTPLFNRLPRGMSLNENGKKLLPAAQQILTELHQLNTMFETPLSGHIHVGIPDDFDDNIFECALADFSRNNPNVEVIAQSGCTASFERDIQNGTLDIAVDTAADKSKHTNIISSEPIVWVASETLTLSENAPIPLVVLDRHCWWSELPTKILNKHRKKWSAIFQSSSFSSQRSAIRAGLGVGILPRNSLEKGLRVLSQNDGFPPLPPVHRAILINPDASSELTSAMAKALTQACGTISPIKS